MMLHKFKCHRYKAQDTETSYRYIKKRRQARQKMGSLLGFRVGGIEMRMRTGDPTSHIYTHTICIYKYIYMWVWYISVSTSRRAAVKEQSILVS